MMRRLRSMWQHIVRRDRAERALDDELQACLEILVRQKQNAGCDPETARRLSLMELGGLAQSKESVRAVWSGRWMVGMSRDVRHARRSVLSHRLSTVTAVLSLAIGIGAVTAVYSWGSAVFYRWPSGVREPARLLSVFVDGRGAKPDPNVVAPVHIRELRESTRNVFTDIGGTFRFWLSLNADRPAEEATVEFVTGNLFSIIGAPLFLGRGIEPRDDVPGAERMVVLSYRTWTRLFEGSPDVIGRTVRLNGQACTIVGVTAPDFEGLEYSLYGAPALWAAAATYVSTVGPINERASRFRAVARLTPDASMAAVAAVLDEAGRSLSYQPTDYRRYTTATTMPLTSTRIPTYTKDDMRQYFLVLMTVTALILLAGCINIANLLLGQGVARAGEMGVRLALGATRRQLFQQLIVECLMLGAAGGVLGLGLAYGFADLLERYPPVNGLGSVLRTPAPIDLRAAAFAWVVAAGATVVFGLVPAVVTSMRSPLAGRMGSRWSSSGGLRLRQGLLGSQVAFAVVIAVVSALYAQSLWRLNGLHYPYSADDTLLARIGANALSPERRIDAYRAILANVRQQPQVAAAGVSFNPLLAIGSASAQAHADSEIVRADFSEIGSGFLDTMGLPLIEGRDFRDNELGAPVAIMNRTLADRLWPNEPAVGRLVRFPTLAAGQIYTVVGVVDQPRCQDRMLAPSPCVYWPLRAARPGAYTLHVRTHGDPHTFIEPLRRLIASVDSDIVVDRTMTLSEHLEVMRTGPRVTAIATVVMASLASILSAIGACALLFTLLKEARREIAIRVALGSSRHGLIRLFMQRALIPYAAGAAAGTVGAWWVAQQIAGGLFATSPHNPAAFVLPTTCLLVIGIGASYWLTRLASAVPPSEVLRG